MKVLAYSGATPFMTRNGYMNVVGPVTFNASESMGGTQQELEAAFGVVLQPDKPVSVLNTTMNPLALHMQVDMHWDGDRSWGRPVAVGVMRNMVNGDGSFNPADMMVVQSMDYQHVIGNMMTMNAVLPMVAAHSAVYVVVGSYDVFRVTSYTMKLMMA